MKTLDELKGPNWKPKKKRKKKQAKATATTRTPKNTPREDAYELASLFDTFNL